jgi:hypothetical protein
MSDDTENKTTRERISIANQVYAGYPLFNQVLEDSHLAPIHKN